MAILDLLFPKFCLECKKSGSYLCEDCLAKVRRGRPLHYAISLFRYVGIIRKAVIALKYKFASDIARELAEACVERLRSYDLQFKDIVLAPIPLHRLRQNWRGFNQVEEVGKLIAGELSWKFAPDLFIRKTSSKPQVGLAGAERGKNIRGVFKFNRKYSYLIHNSKYRMLIFDDVLTTGSTLKEAIKVLKRNGFQNVFGLTIAG